MPSVPGFVHTPGNHCGSTALRNLLAFHGVQISEEMAFGLGAGAGFYYLAMDDSSPSRWFNGRTARLEESFRELTGAALELRTFAEDDGDAGWEAARATVDAGRPALLLTDIYHLDHYGNSAHFPGHAVVLAGYDEEVARLSDTGFEELQATRLENLARARHSGHPAYPLEGHMFTVAEAIDREQLEAAVPRAIERAVSEMLEPPFGEFAGVPALERLAAEVGSWPEAVEDWQWCARFAYQVIERRGTGGGCFRLMYARFLEEAGREEAPLAAEAAARWTELAEAFKVASESEEPEPRLWETVGAGAQAVLEAERRLWTSLG
ncbi:MAG TPA: BtrH N-terminal domain-containing protein [Solirubrobacterales bacterium]|nr:BtrH N-terminal domain-containing protein [Solirubrobacterales bacterium]